MDNFVKKGVMSAMNSVVGAYRSHGIAKSRWIIEASNDLHICYWLLLSSAAFTKYATFSRMVVMS